MAFYAVVEIRDGDRAGVGNIKSSHSVFDGGGGVCGGVVADFGVGAVIEDKARVGGGRDKIPITSLSLVNPPPSATVPSPKYAISSLVVLVSVLLNYLRAKVFLKFISR